MIGFSQLQPEHGVVDWDLTIVLAGRSLAREKSALKIYAQAEGHTPLFASSSAVGAGWIVEGTVTTFIRVAINLIIS